MAAQSEVQVIINAQDNASKTLNKIGNEMKDMGGNFKAGAAVAAAGAAVLLAAVAALGKQMLETAGQIEQNRVAFETLTGSVEVGRQTLQDLINFAAKTPFTIPGIVDSSQKLLAYGVTTQELIPTITTLGNIAAGVGTDKLPQLILAFGQVKAATKLTGMELRQFSEAGVPLLQTLADQAGVTAAQMQEMITDKAVGFEDVKKALESLTSEGGKFFNLMDKQSKTLGGQLSNLQDNFTKVVIAIFGTGEEGTLLYTIAQALTRVNEEIMKLLPTLESFGKWLAENQEFLLVFAGAIAGLIVLIGVGLVAAFSAVTGIALGMMAAFVLIPAALGLIAALIIKNWEGIVDFFTTLWANIIIAFETAKLALQMTVEGIVLFFSELPARVMAFITKLFIEDIPFAWGYLAGWLSVKVPELLNNIVKWFNELPGKILQVMLLIVKTQIDNWTAAINWIAKELPTWGEKIKGFISDIPDKVKAILEMLIQTIKEKLLGGAGSAWSQILDFKDKVVGAFNAIVDAVNKAIDAIKKGFKEGVKGAGSYQVGGVVPGAIGDAQMAIVHGGEQIIPAGAVAPGSGGGGGGVSITVQVGLYAGSETEKRNIAQMLYESLLRVSQAQNKSVAEFMGG